MRIEAAPEGATAIFDGNGRASPIAPRVPSAMRQRVKRVALATIAIASRGPLHPHHDKDKLQENRADDFRPHGETDGLRVRFGGRMPLWCPWGHLTSSGRKIPMRVLPIATILALLVMSQAAHAKEKAIAEKPVSVPTLQTYSAAESEAAGKAARRKADEQQSAWDKKTKSITRGICSGC
jgi:hypothetical protein